MSDEGGTSCFSDVSGDGAGELSSSSITILTVGGSSIKFENGGNGVGSGTYLIFREFGFGVSISILFSANSIISALKFSLGMGDG